MLRYVHHRELLPTATQYEDAANYLADLTGLRFSADHVRAMLWFFPFAHIEVAENIHFSYVQDALKNAVCRFFLGCRWPVYRDKVDMAFFLKMLREQAESMGFSRFVEDPPSLTPEELRAAFVVISKRDTKD
jgi:hypothetical protein